MRGGELKINIISTSHSLAKELLNKSDTFITAMCGNREYTIGGIKRIKTHANVDDSVTHLVIELKEYEGGNIIR